MVAMGTKQFVFLWAGQACRVEQFLILDHVKREGVDHVGTVPRKGTRDESAWIGYRYRTSKTKKSKRQFYKLC